MNGEIVECVKPDTSDDDLFSNEEVLEDGLMDIIVNSSDDYSRGVICQRKRRVLSGESHTFCSNRATLHM
jgi:hypothetical protein